MQSSTVGQGHSQKAVDGSSSSFFNPSSCTMTEAERAPWFYVNLLEPVLVQLIRIDFGASCCQGRPATITVRVGNNRPDLGTNPVCRKFSGLIEEGRPLYLPCTRPMAGAFVSVQLESSGSASPLSICELFVYTDHALSIEQCPTFRDKPLGGTSTYDGKCYIFYNEQPLNLENAKKFCDVRGGTLVDETSPALQGFLSWELYRRHRNDPNGQYWLGAIRDPRTHLNWKWINGKDVSISFWNMPIGRENCSRFDGTKGWLWSDTNCNAKLNYICQHRPLSCGRPERPPNSTVLIRSVDVGQTIEYLCNEGNLIIGPNIRTCMSNGFFSEYAPKCKYIECGQPQSIKNGMFILNNSTRSYLSTLSYQCDEGHVLVGRGNLICDSDGLWNGPPPRCEPVLCPNPPSIEKGRSVLISNSTRFDSVVEYACDFGYELIGNQFLQCNRAGYWDGQPGYCVEKILPDNSSIMPDNFDLNNETIISTTTPSTTTTTTPTTTMFPTTFFDFNPIRNSQNTIEMQEKKTTTSSQSKLSSLDHPHHAIDHSTVSELNPYNNRESSNIIGPFSTPSTTITSSRQTTNESSSILSTIVPSTTTSTVSNRFEYNHSFRKLGNISPHSNNLNLRSNVSHPSATEKVDHNEILDNFGNNPKGIIGKPSRIAAARLNMGGIIALGIFGGFVFLAAVITIIVIIVRSYKVLPFYIPDRTNQQIYQIDSLAKFPMRTIISVKADIVPLQTNAR
ncbi:mRNA export protein [Sarcoptes scabiei]|nr:mRNA export protein [Sarcoptes scabiei]